MPIFKACIVALLCDINISSRYHGYHLSIASGLNYYAKLWISQTTSKCYIFTLIDDSIKQYLVCYSNITCI